MTPRHLRFLLDKAIADCTADVVKESRSLGHTLTLRRTGVSPTTAPAPCSRDLVADACAYANICETCPNYVTAPEFAPAIEGQLADIRQLRDDADERGWTSETARHQRVITSLEAHLHRLKAAPPSRTSA